MKIKIKTWDEMVYIGKEDIFFGTPCIDMLNGGTLVTFIQDMDDLLPEDRIVDLEYDDGLDVWVLPSNGIDWEIYPCMVAEVIHES